MNAAASTSARSSGCETPSCARRSRKGPTTPPFQFSQCGRLGVVVVMGVEGRLEYRTRSPLHDPLQQA